VQRTRTQFDTLNSTRSHTASRSSLDRLRHCGRWITLVWSWLLLFGRQMDPFSAYAIGRIHMEHHAGDG